ncbi:17184_t:CDS:1, partial [Racocetra persica]
FNKESIEWSNKIFQELEEYWKSLANNINLSNNNLHKKNEWLFETDLTTWLYRFTIDMIVVLSTGERSYSMASHYNTLSPIKVTCTGTVIEDSERFLQALKKRSLGTGFFVYLGSFLRNHAPIIKDKAKEVVESQNYMFNKLKKRRQEIKDTTLGVELRHYILTSLITANIKRSINRIKSVKDELNRPMTDKEIGSVLFDIFRGEIDT